MWAPNSTEEEGGREGGRGAELERGQTRLGRGCRRGQVTGAVGGLTMEAPSVPVSHYKSGVTQSAEDNRPPHLIKRHRLLLRVKAAIDFTLTHSLPQNSLPAHGQEEESLDPGSEVGGQRREGEFTDVTTQLQVGFEMFPVEETTEPQVFCSSVSAVQATPVEPFPA
ncbi:hypothetical protein F7725_014623 [Dissostichus mawsoni]|uniref:Uncharacterized protein n=1 Tax=Dissostichus mawsoni TaxID=36200 RepID=A0A7J5YWN9_DISMA|nr:hypothetical protein F7725_014623 [Dissostichus mawsoni]